MKTVLEMLIEKIDFMILYYENELSLKYHAPIISQIIEGKLSELKEVKRMSQSLLPLEKQQMNEIWLDSTMQFDNAAEMPNKITFEDYYKTTFNK